MAEPILGVTHGPTGLALLPGACDCHTHIFGPATRFALDAARSYTPGEAAVEDLLRFQAVLGLQRVVIVHPSPYGADNACTLDALARLGNRARGVAVIDATASTPELYAMQAAGIRGVRVNLESAGQHDPARAQEDLWRAAEQIAPQGWHVQVFTTLAMIASLHDVLRALPVTVVIDHYGLASAAAGPRQPGFDALLDLVGSGKAYVKLSAAHRISALPDQRDVAPIAGALASANPKRILWGSDWPHPGSWPGRRRDPGEVEAFHPIDDGLALNRLATWLDDDWLVRRMLVDNPADLYGFRSVTTDAQPR